MLVDDRHIFLNYTNIMLPQTLLTFAAGLAIMLGSAEIFLRVTQRAAASWKFSPLFISVVLIALGTTLPEFALTLTALAQNDPGLALGNLVGSSIVNITLVLGLATMAGSVKIGTHKTQRNALMLLGATCLFVGLQFSSLEPTTKSAIFFLAVAISLTYQYFAAKNGRLHEDKKSINKLVKIQKKKRVFPGYVMVAAFFASGAGLGLGGYLTVQTVDNLSSLLNISTTFLGLTLTAVATSFPEIILTVMAARELKNKVVVGTLLGSNIFNLTLYPGIILLFSKPVHIASIEFVFLLVATITVATVIFCYKGKIIPKKISLLLLGIFLLFLYATYQSMAYK